MLCQTSAFHSVFHLEFCETMNCRFGFEVSCSPEIQPDFISTKCDSKKQIWCSRFTLGALTFLRISEK